MIGWLQGQKAVVGDPGGGKLPHGIAAGKKREKKRVGEGEILFWAVSSVICMF